MKAKMNAPLKSKVSLAECLNEFQDTVHSLQETKRLGLVGLLFIEKRISHGPEHIDFVMIQGGLTSEGRRIGRNICRIIKRLILPCYGTSTVPLQG